MDNNTENKNLNDNNYQEDNIGIENVNENADNNGIINNIQPFTETKNIKPLLGVVVALIVILLAYFFFWRSIAAKTKNVVADALSTFSYESIGVSGFPLSKNIKIKDITFGNDSPFISQNKVKMGEIEISSFIFGSTFNIKMKDISVITTDGAEYNLMYNTTPNIKISFYPDGKLKDFEYKDNGYRVLSAETNDTLYTAGESTFNIKTVENGNTLDFAISGLFKDLQNFEVLNLENQNDNEVPEKYNFNIDISTSITRDNSNNVSNYIIKINLFDVLGDKGNGIQVSGEIIKDADDVYSYGNIKLAILNYKAILDLYKQAVLATANSEELSSLVNIQDQAEFENTVNSMFNKIQNIIAKNPTTTDKKGVISIVKQKNTPDYSINGQSLYGIIQDILLTE